MFLIFWFDLFLDARGEILIKKKKLKIWRHQKEILKLTDLYITSHLIGLTPIDLKTFHLASNTIETQV